MNENIYEKKVLEKITPTKDYRIKLETIIKDINKKLEKQIKKRKLPVTIELVGSTAKDTYLKDDLDIDFFLKFPTRYSKDEIAKNTLIIGKSILSKTEESYAEHPYIRGYYQKYLVEVVPCYKIESTSQKMSAVDRTPYHTRYVIDKLNESQRPEVRLFKQFLKGIDCYGAESEIEGFSGYLCEILIIKYQNFKKLLSDAKNWKEGKKLSLTDEDTPDFNTPLIFIDPVDVNRNVASALSSDKFNLFVRAADEYLKNPKITFFFPNKIKPWTLEKISEKIDRQDCKYMGIKINKPDIIDENLYPQARKASKSIWESCERADFTIYDIRFYIDEEKKDIYFIIKTKDEILPKTFTHTGPPKKLKSHMNEFLKKWENDPRVIKKPYEKNERYFVEIKREYTDISDFLDDQMKNLSLGKHLDRIVSKEYKILEKSDILIDRLSSFWTEYLDAKMSWER